MTKYSVINIMLITERKLYMKQLTIRNHKLAELNQLMEKYRVIKKQPIAKHPTTFLSIETANYSLSNGKIIEREEMLKRGGKGNAVVIYPDTTEGNVVLVVQSRVFEEDAACVELPAGLVDDKEKFDDPELMTVLNKETWDTEEDRNYAYAALRELVEETGMIPESLTYLDQYYSDQGSHGYQTRNYYAAGCKQKRNLMLDNSEYLDVYQCQAAELDYLMKNQYIKDVNSKYTIALVKTRKRR